MTFSGMNLIRTPYSHKQDKTVWVQPQSTQTNSHTQTHTLTHSPSVSFFFPLGLQVSTSLHSVRNIRTYRDKYTYTHVYTCIYTYMRIHTNTCFAISLSSSPNQRSLTEQKQLPSTPANGGCAAESANGRLHASTGERRAPAAELWHRRLVLALIYTISLSRPT